MVFIIRRRWNAHGWIDRVYDLTFDLDVVERERQRSGSIEPFVAVPLNVVDGGRLPRRRTSGNEALRKTLDSERQSLIL